MIYPAVGLVAFMLIWKYEDSARDDYGEIEHQKALFIQKLYLGHLVYTILTIIFY